MNVNTNINSLLAYCPSVRVNNPKDCGWEKELKDVPFYLVPSWTDFQKPSPMFGFTWLFGTVSLWWCKAKESKIISTVAIMILHLAIVSLINQILMVPIMIIKPWEPALWLWASHSLSWPNSSHRIVAVAKNGKRKTFCIWICLLPWVICRHNK